ncbi:Uncharacterized protein OS=Blastopirellula marina DSM 3645 GN=DSM3645_04295 PE=4 SV=1 [Gemmata massiliana]|uniref:Uncharacterized protein n=1 Tax=Gemmata massiliana TaxID=1210884 RepID=A0A6P2DLA0_9BACT|nr:hypothetical protein [Gemmata massiliana]VTS03174.1 Uncharacterized protein OS=Blastopirellula marina DSM 3645 GN=DSM3645_04295 PE=4 SV=1 [Gemmata massiliana]
MADGRDQSGGFSYRTALPWTNIFRSFQIALDPRKLFVAALGILAMSFSWWLLSNVFYYKAPLANDPEYGAAAIEKSYEGKKKANDTNYTADDFTRIGAEKYKRDYEQWQVLDSLAGPGGRLRTLPWYEYRGPNPFLFFTDALGGSSEDRARAVYGFISGSVPVLVEPLVKLLLPVAKLLSPGVSPQTRLYLFLILLSNVAVWAFCGGVITRLAAVQLANKGPITLKQAVQFVAKRYLSYLGAPLVPLGIISLVVVGLILYGLLALIPFIGDIVLLGVGLPLVIVGGAIMTVFLVGLVGYPMMYTTLSVEGDQSDTFDALSRSVNYVYQAPWHYLWNWFVAIIYGAAVTLFVLFFASVAVYVGKWAVGLTASGLWQDRKPEYMFVYAPESFGWRELLTKDSPYAVQGEWTGLDRDGKETTDPTKVIRQVYHYKPVNQEIYDESKKEFWMYNKWGAGLVCFWLTLAFLMMLGFSYSFFWSSATMIYFLMRKKVDEAELDEVFEDDEPEAPLAPPKLAPTPAPAPADATVPLGSSLLNKPAVSPPVVVPPVVVSPPPVVVQSPPPPPATLPFNPPTASSPPPAPAVSPPTPVEEPKKPADDAPLG